MTDEQNLYKVIYLQLVELLSYKPVQVQVVRKADQVVHRAGRVDRRAVRVGHKVPVLADRRVLVDRKGAVRTGLDLVGRNLTIKYEIL